MSTWRWLVLAAVPAVPVCGQFGGAGYEPPAPICPSFTCPAGQKAVGKPDHQIWSYGCKESNILDASSFNFKDPLGGMKQGKNVNKCCIERDICKQTCGMTSKACHDGFQKCSKKVCGADQNCQLQAMMSDIMSDPVDPEEDKSKYDPKEAKCKGYNKHQKDACMCAPKEDFKTHTETNLKSFYGKYNPDKLDDMGDIKDVEEVWKKWSKKEPDMFMALAMKYKDKAVEIREKPKPPPYKPPPKDADAGTEAEPEELRFPKAEEVEVDPEEAAFKAKRVELETKKREAKEAEDFDVAGEAKEELKALIETEKARLNKKKSAAIEDEDFIAAKKLKARIAKLSEL